MPVTISDIQLFNSLKTKLGEKEAEDLVTFVTASIRNEIQDQVPGIATKDFVEKKVAELETQIAKTESRLILWAFAFWVTQLGAIFAFLKFFIK